MKHDEKKCSKCNKVKKDLEFNKNSSSSDGLYSQCKVCSRKISLNWYYTKGKEKRQTPEYKAKHYQAEKERRKKNPYLRVAERHRAFARKIGMDYGELESWYTKQFLKQQAHCAICGKITEELCVDHNHTTNQIRGLLCRDCNYGVGCFKDSLNFMAKGVEYLTSYAA